MKLSEAIMLGRHLVDHPKGGDLETCALGMALKAYGLPARRKMPGYSHEFSNYCALYERYPWLEEKTVGHCELCDSALFDYLSAVYHYFDTHVMHTGQMTMDQLCDWVKTVEPAEDGEAARALGERDHAQGREVADSQEGRAELLRVGGGTRP